MGRFTRKPISVDEQVKEDKGRTRTIIVRIRFYAITRRRRRRNKTTVNQLHDTSENPSNNNLNHPLYVKMRG